MRSALLLLTGAIIAIAAHSLFMASDLGAQQPVHGEITSHHQLNGAGPLGETAQAEVCPESNTFVAPRVELPGVVVIVEPSLPRLQDPTPPTRAVILSFMRPDTTCALFQVFRL